MKKQIVILIAIAAFATAFTTNAAGQSGKSVRANVKFDFQIGKRVYPAGEYWVEAISPQRDNILRIRSVSDVNKQQFIVAGHSSAGKRQTPKLVRAVTARVKPIWLSHHPKQLKSVWQNKKEIEKWKT